MLGVLTRFLKVNIPQSPCSFKSETIYRYLSISISVNRNNKIRHVLGMYTLIRKEVNYRSFTTSLTCFKNCFSVYDQLWLMQENRFNIFSRIRLHCKLVPVQY